MASKPNHSTPSDLGDAVVLGVVTLAASATCALALVTCDHAIRQGLDGVAMVSALTFFGGLCAAAAAGGALLCCMVGLTKGARLLLLRRRAERSAAASEAYTGQPAGAGWSMPVDRALRQRAERDALAYAAAVSQ